MTNELTLPAPVAEAYPALSDVVREAMASVARVQSFESFEDEFLRGRGLSPHTYRMHADAVRALYRFTEGLHYCQWTPPLIERFAETIATPSTRLARMSGLKSACRGVHERIPIWTSPFEQMSDELREKLFKAPGQGRPKRSLNVSELQRIYIALAARTDLWATSTLALLRLLIGSGLRADEAVARTWGDLEQDDKRVWWIEGVGKGDQPFLQEIADEKAVPLLRALFRKQAGRAPRADDPLLLAISERDNRSVRALSYISLYRRITRLPNELPAGTVSRKMIWSPHLMRRTCGSVLHALGMSPVGVQRFLRHKSLLTTTRHYLDSEERASGFLSKLDEAAAT